MGINLVLSKSRRNMHEFWTIWNSYMKFYQIQMKLSKNKIVLGYKCQKLVLDMECISYFVHVARPLAYIMFFVKIHFYTSVLIVSLLKEYMLLGY